MKISFRFIPHQKKEFISKFLNWADTNDVFCFFDGNQNEVPGISYKGFITFAGVGMITDLRSVSENDFTGLRNYFDAISDTLIGFLSYDLKNQTEKVVSENQDEINMPLCHFFQPELTFNFSESGNDIIVDYNTKNYNEIKIHNLINSIERISIEDTVTDSNNVNLNCRVSKKKYCDNIRKIKEHIQLGDVYELNYCIEFFAENAVVNPVQVYQKLNIISPAPFSCIYKVDNKYLISASPERFMKKEGEKMTVQPMKGTSRRSPDKNEDKLIRDELFNSEKERAENVMIVDLVRNDLSRTAKKNSVKVEELFGIYSFKNVHQMVSTVSSELRNDIHFVDAIKSAFPMGSMTGAPKVSAMNLIEKYEVTKRGLFSGAVGYITPEKNFDFNVVIRSIQYNADKKYLSFMVGSAITIDSDPEKEYDECMLKAKSLIEALK